MFSSIFTLGRPCLEGSAILNRYVIPQHWYITWSVFESVVVFLFRPEQYIFQLRRSIQR
jgi:hypothetical protein